MSDIMDSDNCGRYLLKYFGKTDKTVFAVMDRNGKILDCNSVFLSVLGMMETPSLFNFYDLLSEPRPKVKGIPDSGEYTISFKNNKTEYSLLKCYFFDLKKNIVMIGESLHLSGDKIIEKISGLNQQMSDMSRELSRKNRDLNNLMKLQQETNNRKGILLNSSSDAIALIDTDGRIEEFNSFFSEVFEIRKNVNTGDKIEDYFNNDIRGFFKKSLAEVLKTKEPFSAEKQAEERYILFRLFPVLNGEAGIINIACFFSDITQRKKMETLAIEASRFEIAEEMTSGIAHDINNLLMGLSANLQILELQSGEEKILKRILLSKEIVNRTSSLVEQMLSYTQGLNLEFELLDLNILVESVLKMNMSEENRRIKVSFVKYYEEALVNADSRLLKQSLYQILKNAYEAIESEGVISVKIDLSKDGKKALIMIEDSGAGIPDDIMKKIYDPFFSTKFLGRGMGLPAVLGIIKSHSGSLKIKSSDKQGTLVIMSLPCAGVK